MGKVLRLATVAALLVGVSVVGGCTSTVPAEEFLAKYATNIDVPNPDRPELPCRVFLGELEEHYYIKDVIPFAQGGGFLGKTMYWCCPASELPEGFTQTVRPGDVIFDGRLGAKHTYLIQWFRKQSSGSP